MIHDSKCWKLFWLLFNRLRSWETRERRKAKDHEKDKEKEISREEVREREAKRLKEFLEDYDDERDDPKYYKLVKFCLTISLFFRILIIFYWIFRGKELQRRLAERVREADSDLKDREKEKAELEELKNKVFSSELENPNEEFEKVLFLIVIISVFNLTRVILWSFFSR